MVVFVAKEWMSPHLRRAYPPARQAPGLQKCWHQARRGHDRGDQNRIMPCLKPLMNVGHAGTAEDDGRRVGAGLDVRDMTGNHGGGPLRIMFEFKDRHTACQNGAADITETLLLVLKYV